jgi:ubiquinone/menaquinone biosynthesis C-methylase UbiE
MKESPYVDPAMVGVYDRIAAPFQFAAPAKDLVQIAGLTEGGMVLDVGTGTGVVAAVAKATVGNTGSVVGTDAAFEMIHHARKQAAHLVVASVPALPFVDETFDAVIAGFVVSHFESYLDGLREMIRVCRTGGNVGMSAWGSAPNPAASLWSDIAAQFMPRERLNEAFLQQIPWDSWFSRIENVTEALQSAGLSSVITETRFYLVRMSTKDYLLSRESSMQGLILKRQLTSALWYEFGKAVADAFGNKFGEWVEYERDAHFGVGTRHRRP